MRINYNLLLKGKSCLSCHPEPDHNQYSTIVDPSGNGSVSAAADPGGRIFLSGRHFLYVIDSKQR